MSDPLDDVRRALGIPTTNLPQEAGTGASTSPSTFDAAAAQHDARAKAHEEERARLAAAGDDADGLEHLRREFRRYGRG